MFALKATLKILDQESAIAPIEQKDACRAVACCI
jgi:hypothetical protein